MRAMSGGNQSNNTGFMGGNSGILEWLLMRRHIQPEWV